MTSRPPIVSSLVNNNDRGSSSSRTSPAFIPSTELSTRLILHLDINETILLEDESGGDSRQDSVNKMLAKSAFCQIPHNANQQQQEGQLSLSYEDTSKLSPTHWWDGQQIGKESSIPPLYTGWTWPKGCCPYYRTSYKKISKNFVEHHGKVYQPVLNECEQAIAHKSAKGDESHFLPALYHTLNTLITREQEQPFTVVFRTFGTDLPHLAQAILKFSKGQHPNYAGVHHSPFCAIQDNLYQGRWKKASDDGTMIYQLWDLEETVIIASGDREILALLGQVPICGIRDDYPFWANNQWEPFAGKPIWVPRYDSMTNNMIYDHHILFDDNIHNLRNDGIACVREEQIDGTFVTVDASVMHQEYQGRHMVRVPTIEPVLNVNWFIDQIAKARNQVIDKLVFSQELNGDNRGNK